MLKSINEEISKKNKKQYDSLKSQKEKLEEKKKEKAKENLEQKKIKVNAIKKLEDKEKNEKESTIDKNAAKNSEETMKTLLSSQEKINYLREKDLIEQYKSFCEELIKQEKEYMEKIEEAKKMTKNRSGSTGKIRILAPKNKNKEMNNRTKSSYKVNNNDISETHMNKYKKKLKETKQNNEKGNNNIKKINANEI